MNEIIPLDIFYTEAFEWFSYPGIERFRRCNWIFENFIYLHFDSQQNNPNIPIEEITRIDLLTLVDNNYKILQIFSQVENAHRDPLYIQSEIAQLNMGQNLNFIEQV